MKPCNSTPHTVIPAEAGTHGRLTKHNGSWVPACAGMTPKQGETGEIEIEANGCCASQLPIAFDRYAANVVDEPDSSSPG